jgi:hypothetical protein
VAHDERRTPGRAKRIGWAAGLLAGGAVTGVVLAGALPATAESGTASPGASAPAGTPSGAAPRRDNGTLPPQRSDETVLTGSDAEKAKAAALKAVPGGTVDRVETDADGAVYEAHMTRSDGSRVTVKFDKDFNVTAVQDGMGSHT